MQPPSSEHWLGTDDNGRDMLSLVILGSRISLVVGFTAALVSSVIGAVVGISAGYFGGWTDRALTALDDWFLVIPFLPLAIVTASLLGRGAQDWPFGQVSILILVIGLTGWAGTSRIVRSQVLSVKERAVRRARALDGRVAAVDPAQAHPAQRAADPVRQHRADHRHRDPHRVDPLVPRPRRPDETRRGARSSSSPTTPARWRRARGGTSCRRASASCWSCWRFTLVGYAIEEIVNPVLRSRR